jgi:hypothetical protein
VPTIHRYPHRSRCTVWVRERASWREIGQICYGRSGDEQGDRGLTRCPQRSSGIATTFSTLCTCQPMGPVASGHLATQQLATNHDAGPRIGGGSHQGGAGCRRSHSGRRAVARIVGSFSLTFGVSNLRGDPTPNPSQSSTGASGGRGRQSFWEHRWAVVGNGRNEGWRRWRVMVELGKCPIGPAD